MRALRIEKNIHRARAHGDANAETFGLRLYGLDRHWRGAGLSGRWGACLIFAGAQQKDCSDSEGHEKRFQHDILTLNVKRKRKRKIGD